MTDAPSPPAPERPPRAAWYSRLGNVAQISSALVGLFGFAIIIYQLGEARTRTAIESARHELGDARRNYMSYSDASLRYPHLSFPDYDALMRNHIEYLRYQNFVAHMIYAYDDMLNAVEDAQDRESQREWRLSFEVELEPHHRYLCQVRDQRIFRIYRPSIQALLENNIKSCTEAEKAPLKEIPQAAAKIPDQIAQ